MQSVLNRTCVDTTKQPLFFGEDLSIQRYDKFRYEIFMKLFDKQIKNFWRPEEISLQKDRHDYETLTPNEQFIFTSNLKFQTMLDSVIARGVPTVLEYITNPELEACCVVWQFFEQIHSYSYTYIIKNVYNDPGVVFDTILEDAEIVKRADVAVAEYDKLRSCTNRTSNLDKLKDQVYLTLIAINILEAIRFYVSFVCAFTFCENKKMVGNTDIIKLIKRDEFLHLSITQNILRILAENKSEGFLPVVKRNHDKAVAMFEHAVTEEKAWAAYLFKDGGLLGLNESILHQYIEHLAGQRMKQIGLEPLYDTKNPVGWLDKYMESKAVQVAPQESEILSYQIGASENDLDDVDLDAYSL